MYLLRRLLQPTFVTCVFSSLKCTRHNISTDKLKEKPEIMRRTWLTMPPTIGYMGSQDNLTIKQTMGKLR